MARQCIELRARHILNADACSVEVVDQARQGGIALPALGNERALDGKPVRSASAAARRPSINSPLGTWTLSRLRSRCGRAACERSRWPLGAAARSLRRIGREPEAACLPPRGARLRLSAIKRPPKYNYQTKQIDRPPEVRQIALKEEGIDLRSCPTIERQGAVARAVGCLENLQGLESLNTSAGGSILNRQA